METSSRYTNSKYLILILYRLKFLNEPNMTLRQLRGFLGITGYCNLDSGLWELAWSLYKLITETQ